MRKLPVTTAPFIQGDRIRIVSGGSWIIDCRIGEWGTVENCWYSRVVKEWKVTLKTDTGSTLVNFSHTHFSL